jgi:hypothetical protein
MPNSPCLELEWNPVYTKYIAIPLQARRDPYTSRTLKLPEFTDNWHMKVVRLSVLYTGHLNPHPEISLVLISVRGWVNSRATVRPKGSSQWKIPIIPSGIKPTTFQLVAQWSDIYSVQLGNTINKVQFTHKYKLHVQQGFCFLYEHSYKWQSSIPDYQICL